jgi:hypothetical protein
MIGNVTTGIGNPDPCILTNEWTSDEGLNSLIKEMLDEAIQLYFKEYGGCDFQIEVKKDEIRVKFGIEPAYKFEKYKLIIISTNPEYSKYETGIAWGYYGSDIVKTRRKYLDYKYKSKFPTFIGRWTPKLQAALQ